MINDGNNKLTLKIETDYSDIEGEKLRAAEFFKGTICDEYRWPNTEQNIHNLQHGKVHFYCAIQKSVNTFINILTWSNRKKNSQETQIYTLFLQKNFAKIAIK